jgi:hypothetical protein
MDKSAMFGSAISIAVLLVIGLLTVSVLGQAVIDSFSQLLDALDS